MGFNSNVGIFDDHNNPIATAPKSNVLNQGMNFRVVHVLLDDGENFLLQRLSKNHPRYPGRLGSSAAGHILHNEDAHQAALRKEREELEIEDPVIFVGEFRMHDQDSWKFVYVFQGVDVAPKFYPA